MFRRYWKQAGTTAICVVTVALSFAVLPQATLGETRGTLGYDADTDAGYLQLWGTSGNRHSRLWVDGGGDNDRGRLQLYDDGSERVKLMVDSHGRGYLRLKGSTGESAARLAVNDDGGRLQLYDDGDERLRLMVDSHSQGYLQLRGSSGETAAKLTVNDDTDAGLLYLYDRSGETRATLKVDDEGQGELILDGGFNTKRVFVGVHDENDGGVIKLYNAIDNRTFRIDSTTYGSVLRLYNGFGHEKIVLDGDTGDISKSGSNGFLVPHPTEPGKEIFYTAVEGPERGLYVRGSAFLADGRSKVMLPRHFALLARAEDMTVQVTPGSAETYGLAVVSKTPSAIEVRELAGGKGSFSFDYLVFSSRKDMPPLQVVRDRQDSRKSQTVKPVLENEAAEDEERDLGDEVPDREPMDVSTEKH